MCFPLCRGVPWCVFPLVSKNVPPPFFERGRYSVCVQPQPRLDGSRLWDERNRERREREREKEKERERERERQSLRGCERMY